MTTRLWESNGGEVCCEKHIGMYASSALDANPKLKRIETPLGVWRLMSAAKVTDWLAFLSEYGHTEGCESCRGDF